jgi:hypothetical protein
MNVHGRWMDAADDERGIRWARDFFTTTSPFAAGSAYVNFMTAEERERVPAAFGTFRYAEHYGACSRYSPQGISVGWVDVYQSYLAGQALKLPRWVGDGLYCLRIRVDPKNELVETRDKNNSSVRAFSLRGDKVIYRDSARCRPKA